MSNQRRKILLAVSGMSPQIVTETLYALVTRKENPWIPDEIHLLSTQEGCDRAAMELFHESRDMFAAFCRDYLPEGLTIHFDASCLHPFSRDGQLLPDIRNLEDSASVADAIAAKVWELTQDDNTEIHASIAGGRKSMGFLLGYSMSLYGRPQDRLSHVLVTEGFENCKDFYFPPRNSKIIHTGDGKPLDTANAVIDLAEIPILHLRGKLPTKMKKQVASFAELVDVMNLSLNEPSIVFDVATRSVKCHGIEIGLSRTNYSFYLFLAKKSRDEGLIDPYKITEDEFFSIKKFGLDSYQSETLKAEIHKLCDENGEVKAEEIKIFIDDRKNDIKRALDDKLGLLGLDRYVIKTRNGKCYIEIEDIVVNETCE